MNTQQEWINARIRLNRLLVQKDEVLQLDPKSLEREIQKEKATVSALRGRMIRQQQSGRIQYAR